MKTINFNVNEFPNLVEEFYKQKQCDWIIFLHNLGYKFTWNHYAKKKKYVEMTEDDFLWFKLRWE